MIVFSFSVKELICPRPLSRYILCYVVFCYGHGQHAFLQPEILLCHPVHDHRSHHAHAVYPGSVLYSGRDIQDRTLNPAGYNTHRFGSNSRPEGSSEKADSSISEFFDYFRSPLSIGIAPVSMICVRPNEVSTKISLYGFPSLVSWESYNSNISSFPCWDLYIDFTILIP